MDEVRAPTQAGIRIRGRTYLIHLIHIHPQSQSQCLWQDSQRPQWESLHFRTERRVQDWPRGILLVIFPCFLRFWLRFWIEVPQLLADTGQDMPRMTSSEGVNYIVFPRY